MYKPLKLHFQKDPQIANRHLHGELDKIERAIRQASIFAVCADVIITEGCGLIGLGVEIDSATATVMVKRNGVTTEHLVEATFAIGAVSYARFTQPLQFKAGDVLSLEKTAGTGTIVRQTAWLQMK